ncbi:hypothetical protein TRSC58_04718 [Trypanosoma rangeli SC58]|uniref:Uncharacterized protein n=1 Tax=Trypanosoma rangeli SC58 TaxID=429131 RepID=A0A061IZX8_TRYRA|nr:hypothetical protein TRSC58_04718 [Trypanosoma rangeli SC58]
MLIVNISYMTSELAPPSCHAAEEGSSPQWPLSMEEKQLLLGIVVMPQEMIPDVAVRLLFVRDILPRCREKWAKEGGVNYTLAKELRRRRLTSLLRANKSLDVSSWWSYDDVVRDTFTPSPCAHQEKQRRSGIVAQACDPGAAPPFNTAHDVACIELAQLLLKAAFASSHNQSEWTVGGPFVGWHIFVPLPYGAERYLAWSRRKNMNSNFKISGHVNIRNLLVWVRIDVIAPSLDQRTIKFRSTFCFSFEMKTPPSCLASMAFLVKVPQRQFSADPFAEVAAFAVDRKLGIGRVPPTFIFPIPLAVLQEAVMRRSRRHIRMIPFLIRESGSTTYDTWVQNDVFFFLKRHAERKSGADGGDVHTHRDGLDAWCSFQLEVWHVTPLLRSSLRVPYNKKNMPGWHRWFNPLYNGTVVPYGPLVALSEQVMFDYIVGNNDRSPNKNSFAVIGGCRCGGPGNDVGCSGSGTNSESSTFPTILHLDHGMAFKEPHAALVNNPLAKLGERQSFCMFYKPLLGRLWSIEKQLTQRHTGGVAGVDWGPCVENEKVDRTELWVKYLMANVSRVILRVVGHAAFHASGRRLVRLLQRANECLAVYPAGVVLLP